MAEIYQIPENGGNLGGGVAQAALLASALNGNGNNMGFGNNPLALAFMFPFIMPFVMPFMNMMYGGLNGGMGIGGNGFISNQLNNDSGRQLILSAIQNNGSSIDRIASLLNTTHDQVQEGLSSLNTTILNLGGGLQMTGMQIINAMQSGNAALQSQICQGLSALQATIAQNAAADQLAICQQTYGLTETMNRNYQLLDNKIDALESGRKDREITALTAQVAKLESQGFTAGIVQQALAPVQAQLAAIRSEVDSVKCRLPETVTLPNSQYSVVPAWFAAAGSDFVASYWANRLSAATATAGTGTGAGAGA